MATNFTDMLKDATENMKMVAEAQVALAASGQVSLATFGEQAKALEFLSKGLKEATKLTKAQEDATKKLKKEQEGLLAAVKTFGTQATLAYAAASAGLLSVVRAANPVAFDTFTQSVGLLSAEIGSVFMPIVVHVADMIQDLAYWIEDLDAGTKDSILTWAEVGAAALGTVLVFTKVYQAGQMVVTTIQAIRVASMALIATPWGALLAALALVLVAALAISGAFKDSGEAVDRLLAGASRFEQINEAANEGKATSGKDLKDVLTAQEQKHLLDAGNDQAKRKAAIQQFRESDRAAGRNQITDEGVDSNAIVLQAKLDALQKKQAKTHFFDKAGQEKNMEQREQILNDFFGGNKELKESAKSKLTMGALLNIKDEGIDQVVNAYKAQATQTNARSKVLDNLAQEGAEVPAIVADRKKHLRAKPQDIAAQYQSFAGARQMFQIEALKKSPLENEQMRLQRESIQKLGEISTNTGNTADRLPVKAVGR